MNGVKWCTTYARMSNAAIVAVNAYILQNDGKWHKATTDNTAATIPAYRAYFAAFSPSGNILSTVFGGTTGIRTIKTTDTGGTVRYYDPNGHSIGTTLDGQPTGIYIDNGKKVMKK
ncbi:hypothetical protein [Hoylesella enoeca]|uniref:hypothetical protein n=1 Tax=Hoylesella enoeca TaxID=76123 RepID=UPI00288A3B84|nr:hypothetical protein [Hoylesella enoeca]